MIFSVSLCLCGFFLGTSVLAQDLTVQAEKAIDAKDYPKAMALLNGQLEREPANYRALFNIAYVHTMLGEKPQAIAAYRKALQARPQLTQASLNLGILLLEAREGAEAASHFAAVVAARPKDARPQLLLADAMAMGGDATRAVEEYRKAIALDPKLSEAYASLGRLLAGQKQLAEAEQQFTRAIELRPGDSALRLELARLWEAAGREDDARRFYVELAVKEPGNAAVRRRLGVLLLQKKQFAEAAAEFEAAARSAPAADDDWNLARAYAGAKKVDQAAPILVRVAAAQPQNYDARLLLGEMLAAQRQFQAAQQEFQAAIALRPQLPDAYVGLANVLYVQQNFPATLAVLDRFARIGPPTPWLHFLRAITLDKLDQVEPALTSYESFLAVANGQYPDQEFQARQRARILNLRLEKSGKRRKR